jgi:hypothetical protein
MRCSPLPRSAPLSVLLLCGMALAAPPERSIDELIPPAASLPGWRVAEGPVQYAPETLFEYINGAARMYLSYGFRKLAHVVYASAGDDGTTIDLDIYDMGSELGAYGIYTNGRPLDIAKQSWGSEGYRSGKVAVAWKGQVYIHGRCSAESPALTGLLERLVAAVADAAPGAGEQPDQFKLLPAEGLIRNSDRYVARDLLGHAFLPGGMLARYEIGDERLTLFFCELESEAAARQAVAGLRAYEERDGRLLGDESEIGDSAFRAEDSGLGRALVTRSGRFAAGIFGGSSDAVARPVLARLIANLRARETPLN